jgi:hypothetical protein
MKFDQFDINEFIKVNHVMQVSNSIALDSTGVPTPDGIFSYDIFGYSTDDQKNRFGYIDLNGHFLFPQVYKTMLRLGNLGKILTGDKVAEVVAGKIFSYPSKEAKDHPDAKGGIDFYWDNWDKIDWRKNTISEDQTEDDLSIDKTRRIQYLELLKKDGEVFVSKWLVLPVYYRNFNSQDMSLGDDINKVYNNLIMQTKVLKSGFGLTMFNVSAKNRVQNTINELYDMTLMPVSGKTVDIDTGELVGEAKSSLFRRNLIGRAIDYASYSIITAPTGSSASSSPDEVIEFGQIKNPLLSIVSMFRPFFEKSICDFLENYSNVIKTKKHNEISYIDPSQWSKFEVAHTLDRFEKTGEGGEDLVELKYTDENKKEKAFTPVIYEVTKNYKIYRPMTWLDLLYISAYEITSDKYEIATRYPVTDYNNVYPAKVIVNSTNRTHKAYIMILDDPLHPKAMEFDNYPYISYKKISEATNIKDPDPKPDTYYDLYRVTVIPNSSIKQMGADYDGDMLFFRGLFTKEANAEAEKKVWSPSNFFNPDGQVNRGFVSVGKDAIVSIYTLTKD